MIRGSVVLLLVSFCFTSMIKADEKPKTSYIGVQIAYDKEKKAVFVLMVLPDSPAQKGGLMGGDLILSINDTKPADLPIAVQVIRSLKADKKVKFVIERAGKKKILEITPVSMG